MRLIAFLILFGLSCSWFVSSQEDHLCADESSLAECDLAGTQSYILELTSPEANEHESHDMELCHFGHCSHAIRLNFALSPHASSTEAAGLLTPYNRFEQAAHPLFALRPPALG